MSSAKPIITRFPPSPTGFLHVGGLRTALYNYLVARQHKGKFFLRIEDTDQARIVPGAVEQLLTILDRFGLKRSNRRPMIQSQRLKIYRHHAQDLIDRQLGYYCFCSAERLEELKGKQRAHGLPPMYDGFCRNLNAETIQQRLAAHEPHVIRFAMPRTGQTTIPDLVRGGVVFNNAILDDQIIIKTDGYPTYHLASVVDDHALGVTHVIRGEEWLSSTPKHIILYQAFEWTPPQFAHLPLLLNPDKTKLSKRQGDVAVEDYVAKGYLPEALLNFVLLLGWNPGTDQEIFSLAEMVNAFSLSTVNKSGAVFDTKKLDWLNSHYIRALAIPALAKLCRPYFEQAGIRANQKMVEKVVATEQQRIKTLAEIVDATRFFFEQPHYDPQLLAWKGMSSEDAKINLKNLSNELEKITGKKWTAAYIEETIKKFIETNTLKVGEMLWPMRVALCGRQNSPGPFEIADALGKPETLKRIDYAIKLLEK